jgi:DNA-binding NarL/FixJ family response regulator
MPINVALVEDDSGVRAGLAALINGTSGFRCVGAYPNAEAALKTLKQLRGNWPDVLLMDIHLPEMSGLECVARLKAQRPALKILMLTISEDSNEIFQSLMAGASGYLLKGTPPAELLAAIADAHRGGSPLSSRIAGQLVQYFHRKGQVLKTGKAISKREQEILSLLAKGERYKEIADQLSISVRTVCNHVQRIYDKLHVRSCTEAVAKFLDSKQLFL